MDPPFPHMRLSLPPGLQLRSSWDSRLRSYLECCGDEDPRQALGGAVLAQPGSAEAWWALLAAAEKHGVAADADRGSVQLFDLYRCAVRIVPRSGNTSRDAFVKMWLGFARQQWYASGCTEIVAHALCSRGNCLLRGASVACCDEHVTSRS